MEKSLTLFLLLSSLLCLWCGCHTTKVDASNICPLVLNQRIGTATYDTKIDFYSKHLSGLMVFKALNDTQKRVVFITQTGFKFFDLEFRPDTFIVHYCLPALNKKPVLALFKKDFSLLLNGREDLPTASYQTGSLITYIFALGKNKFDYFTVDFNCKKLLKIESGGRYIKAVTEGIDGMKRGSFENVHIFHKTLGLKIDMKQIDQ